MDPKARARGVALFDLRERVVIVTGGAMGIGRTYCEHLAASGARVVLADLAHEDAERCAAALRSAGADAMAVKVDVADAASVQAMADAVVSRYGRIDGLVNNAALMNQLRRGPWHEIDPLEWDRVMAVNLRGMFLCCRAVHPVMKRQGGGKIVNISSSRVLEGTPNRLHYTTSKSGVVGFTRALAREVGDDGICVNTVSLGYTASEMQRVASDPAYVERMAHLNAGKCLKRTQLPEDVVGAVLFLLSAASDYVTGQLINVDGGQQMH